MADKNEIGRPIQTYPSQKAQGLRLFSRRARTGVLVICGVLLVGVIAIPLGLDRLGSANALEASALARQSEASVAAAYSNDFSPVEESPLAAPMTPSPTPVAHVSKYSRLQVSDDYETVMLLQLRLIQLGYLESDEPSTLYGDSTAAAVSLFQRTIGEEMNGIADIELQETLFSNDATAYEMKLGDSGADVKTMQSRLAELGYYTDKVNGFFGVATETALKAFQTKNKLEVSGVFDIFDRDLLYSPSARPLIDPTPIPTAKPTKRPSSSSSSSSGSSGSSSGSSSGGSSSSGGGSYSASYSADGLISVAQAQIGKSYEWSAEGPNTFDCSGLVYFCLRTCGVSTSRYNAAGFSQVSRWGEVTSVDDLRKGDLIFFRSDDESRVSHTGIYAGGGKFIHASYSKGKVMTSYVTSSYWTRNFVVGRRVF